MEDGLFTILLNVGSDYDIRYEKIGSSSFMVVPVIMMREGVHAGSGGPAYYPPSVIGNDYQSWDGTPVMINHPFDKEGNPITVNSPEGLAQTVGNIFNTTFDSETTILAAEARIDEGRLREVSPAAYNSIISKKPLDVSTGILPELDKTPGEWEGEAYDMTVNGWLPDHLAILPGQKGACSWEDGCGIRLNSSIVLANANLSDRVNAVRNAVTSMDTKGKWHYVEQVHSDHVIYQVDQVGGGNSDYYKQDYTYDKKANKATLTGMKERMTRKVTFSKVSVMNQENKTGGNDNMAEKCTCSEDKVKTLISASKNLTEKDKENLMNLSEETVDEMIANAQKATEAEKEGNKPEQKEDKEITLEAAMEVVANKITPEKLLNLLPKDVQEHIQIGLNSHKEKHGQLVNQLKESQSEYSEEELTAMSVPNLERLSRALGAAAKPVSNGIDYSALGIGTLTNESNEGVPILPGAGIKESN